MTDFEQDPDFLRILHSADKEWPSYVAPRDKNASLPLLISEIYRLVPYIGSEYVYFHPKNMPEVRIDKVDIIGIVTDKTELAKYTSYTVDDASGAIPVLCMNNMFDDSTSEESDDSTTSKKGDKAEPVQKCKEIDKAEPCQSQEDKDAGEAEPCSVQESHEADEAEPCDVDKCKAADKEGRGEDNPNIESDMRLPSELSVHAPYSYERHIRELWLHARDEEPLGDEVDLYDYVHVLGFCAMGFRSQKHASELTDEDIELGRLFFFGIKIRRLSEREHNAMLKSLIASSSKRYLKPQK